jgi:hypothetical protein
MSTVFTSTLTSSTALLFLLLVASSACAQADENWHHDEIEKEFVTSGISSYAAAVYTEEVLTHFSLEKEIPSLRQLQQLAIVDHHDAIAVWSSLHRLRIRNGGGFYQSVISEGGLKDMFQPKRLIFSLNAGRSGSRYLASLLNSCDEVLGLHEPPPGAGGSRDMHNTLLEESFHRRHQSKVPAILKAMTLAHKKTGSTIYAESNPNFKVWFWDVVIEDFSCDKKAAVDVIIIRKYLPAVLKSILELGWYARSSSPVGWLPTGNSVNSPIPAIAPDMKMDEYDKVISYLLFTEGMVHHMKQRYVVLDSSGRSHICPTLRFLEVRAEGLYSKEGALQLLESLGLQQTHQTQLVAGVVIDKFRAGAQYSGERKPSTVKREISLEYCESRVRSYLEKAREKKIEIPELPHLIPYPGYEYK